MSFPSLFLKVIFVQFVFRQCCSLHNYTLVFVSDTHRAAISRDPFYEMLAARKKKVSSMKRH